MVGRMSHKHLHTSVALLEVVGLKHSTWVAPCRFSTDCGAGSQLHNLRVCVQLA